MNRAQALRLVPFGLFLLLGALFWRGLALDPQKLPSTQIGRPVPSFHIPTLEGASPLFTPQDMKGHIALLNVWGSWCVTCTKEHAFLLDLAQKGVVIYGINYKDDAFDAKQWLTQWGNPYKKIGCDRDGRVGIDLGVYGAPETFLVDAQGIIRYRHTGALDAHVWRTVLEPKIRELEAS